MATAARADVIDFLGGAVILRHGAARRDLLAAVREGLPHESMVALAESLALDVGDLATVLGMAPRTLARRKHERRLSPVESDRLYRLAHVVSVAQATLGSIEKARQWLTRENRTLGRCTPLSLLDTDIGARRVEEALVRVSEGIPA